MINDIGIALLITVGVLFVICITLWILGATMENKFPKLSKLLKKISDWMIDNISVSP